jgi:AcrR family transcriptional regulator
VRQLLEETSKPVKKAVPETNTRQSILLAAQLRLARLGADGLRLQDIARDVGVSHPTILHHFGSRDGLIVAMVKHIGEEFVSEIIRRIPLGPAPVPNEVSKVGLVFEILADKGFGGLIGWAYKQRPADIAPITENLFKMAIDSMVQYKTQVDGAVPDEDWQCQLAYAIRMALMAAAGEVLLGKSLSYSLGNSDGFRMWVSDVIARRVGI